MSRLDLLIYAHDGRGLGHASRSVAIGLAVRRRYPALRVLLLTGMKQSASLIGEGGLDWVKLPAYETRVVDGVSRGCEGDSKFSDRDLGVLRAGMIRDLVTRLNPRYILTDHMPQGKHSELLPALEASSAQGDINWVLGMRGVIGDVKGVWSETAVSIFRQFYKDILWYGDAMVLGEKTPNRIEKCFGRPPIPTGYVSRLAEWHHMETEPSDNKDSLATTVSVPWIGEYTLPFLNTLAKVMERIGPSTGKWHLYLKPQERGLMTQGVWDRFRKLPFCRMFKPGDGYLHSLMKSRLAITYGGYNSLTDLLYLGLPGLVILRKMADREQEEHLERLQDLFPNRLQSVNEDDCRPDNLENILRQQLQYPKGKYADIHLGGAETAADCLGRAIEAHRVRLS